MSSTSAPVARDHVVGVAYTLHNDAGELIDSSTDEDLLWYLHGHDNLLPAVEAKLLGRAVGETVTFVLEPAEGYGERVPEHILPLERELLPDSDEYVVGEELLVDLGDGPQICAITKVTPEEVFVDLNHPMAGIRLHFSFTVHAVRPATTEEVEHGHVHGPGGHDHH